MNAKNPVAVVEQQLEAKSAPPALYQGGQIRSPIFQVLEDGALFERTKLIATYVSKAKGLVPDHLIGHPETCFGLVVRALTWRLDPFAVAAATYRTPAGTIGYYGSLCQAILENSGQIDGGVQFKEIGDWERVQGMWKLAPNHNNKHVPTMQWSPKEEEGLGVIVSAQILGQAEPVYLEFNLNQAYPRNSLLWVTDPRTQLKYTAVRRFANTCAPQLFMGVPFDYDSLRDANVGTTTPKAPERVAEISGPTTPTGGELDASALDSDASDNDGDVVDPDTGEVLSEAEVEETEEETIARKRSEAALKGAETKRRNAEAEALAEDGHTEEAKADAELAAEDAAVETVNPTNGSKDDSNGSKAAEEADAMPKRKEPKPEPAAEAEAKSVEVSVDDVQTFPMYREYKSPAGELVVNQEVPGAEWQLLYMETLEGLANADEGEQFCDNNRLIGREVKKAKWIDGNFDAQLQDAFEKCEDRGMKGSV